MSETPDPAKAQKRRSAIAGYVRHYTDREELSRNRFLKPIAHRFLSPELWRFTRRSVPRGVALGFFAGFILPFGQIFLALILAFSVRANVPVASGFTLITNPLTFPFWIWAANRAGEGAFGVIPGLDRFVMASEGLRSASGLFHAGAATVFGFLLFAVIFPLVGYFLSGAIWKLVVRRRRRRRLVRAARALSARRAATAAEAAE